MIIIDKIKEPSPFFVREEIPTFRTELEKDRYWAEEKRRWIEGYSEDVNGMCYHYGTQIWLKNRITGKLIRPEIRDVEIMIFNDLLKAYNNNLAEFIIKGRGVGLSSIGMTNPYYFFKTNPGSTSIATSKNKKTLAEIFKQKAVVAYDNMHPRIQPYLINKNETASESYLNLGLTYIDDYGQEKAAESQLLCRDTQASDDAATGFSGSGALYGFADEAPLMIRFMQFFNSAIECFTDQDSMKIVGLLLLGGTVEHSLKSEDVQRIQQIWINALSLNIQTLFVPATYGKFVVNGHSNHTRAYEEIMRKREEYDKLEDKSKLNSYIKNNPLSIEEIFNFSYSSRWEEEASNQINQQVKVIGDLSQTEKPKAYKIIIRNDGIVAEPVKESSLLILEPPKPNIKYMLGYDGTSTSELTSASKDASHLALTVMKGIHPDSPYEFAPVAIMSERPKSIEESNTKVLNILKHYNQFGRARINGELNAAGEHMIKMIINAGMESTLVTRRNVTKKGKRDTKDYWIYRNDEVLDVQYIYANVYMKRYAERVFFLKLLQDCQLPEEENKDILDSFLACLHGWGSGDIISERPKQKRTTTITVTRYDYVNGVRRPVIEKIERILVQH